MIVRAGDGAVDINGKLRVAPTATVERVLYGSDRRELDSDTLKELKRMGETKEASGAVISLSQEGAAITLYYEEKGSASAYLVLNDKSLPPESRVIALGSAEVKNMPKELTPAEIAKGSLGSRATYALSLAAERRSVGIAFG